MSQNVILAKAVTIIVILALAYGYIRLLEYRTIYYPERRLEAAPKDIGLAYEDVNIVAKDGTALHGWYIPAEGARTVVIFCHGNAGNISHRLDKLIFLHRLGAGVLLFDYRGYGQSRGRPSEKGLYRDGQAVYDHVKSRYADKGKKIVLYGESLGGAVAAGIAAHNQVDAIILEGAFSSAADMSRLIFPFLPVFLLQARFDTAEKISRVDAPLLLMHSREDEIVPYEQGRKIFMAAKGEKQLLELSGGHNEAFFFNEPKIKDAIGRFFAALDSRGE